MGGFIESVTFEVDLEKIHPVFGPGRIYSLQKRNKLWIGKI